MASWFNLSGTLNAFRLFRDPSLCLPHHTVSTFNSLPIPLSKAFQTGEKGKTEVDIRAVVLDKDNCFAIPHKNEVFNGYKVHILHAASSITTLTRVLGEVQKAQRSISRL